MPLSNSQIASLGTTYAKEKESQFFEPDLTEKYPNSNQTKLILVFSDHEALKKNIETEMKKYKENDDTDDEEPTIESELKLYRVLQSINITLMKHVFELQGKTPLSQNVGDVEVFEYDTLSSFNKFQIHCTLKETQENRYIYNDVKLYIPIVKETYTFSNQEIVIFYDINGTYFQKSLPIMKKVTPTSGGAKRKKPTMTKTSQKVQYKNRSCVVYQGTRGGKYIKHNKEYVSLKKLGLKV